MNHLKMSNLKDMFVKRAINLVIEGKMSNDQIISTIEGYLKKSISDAGKKLICEYADKVRKGEITFDQCWEMYKGNKLLR